LIISFSKELRTKRKEEEKVMTYIHLSLEWSQFHGIVEIGRRRLRRGNRLFPVRLDGQTQKKKERKKKRTGIGITYRLAPPMRPNIKKTSKRSVTVMMAQGEEGESLGCREY